MSILIHGLWTKVTTVFEVNPYILTVLGPCTNSENIVHVFKSEVGGFVNITCCEVKQNGMMMMVLGHVNKYINYRKKINLLLKKSYNKKKLKKNKYT